MSLGDLIRKNHSGGVATAIPAIRATVQSETDSTVAKIAKLAVANSKDEFSSGASGSTNSRNSSSKLAKSKNNRSPIPADCIGAAVDPESGALFLPWGPFVSVETLRQWQNDIIEIVDELSKLEFWASDTYNGMIITVKNQSIATLRSDLPHFQRRLEEARIEASKRRARGGNPK
jgi:hypothetical protein